MIFATSVCTLGSSVQPVTGTTNATKTSDSRLWMSTTSCCSKFLVACPSGSNNSWQLYKIILLRATSQTCLQKTSWCQQEKKNTRRIHPTTFKGCDSYNTIARHKICNTCGFKIPDSKTEQYKSSFFIRTVADWNKLKTLWSLYFLHQQ